jgi:hypothetical protein
MMAQEDEKNIIHGYGAPASFDLSVENVIEQTRGMGLGPYLRRYEIDGGNGGNALFSSGSLTGAMYEFESAFFVVWSCGEYIDWAVFRKRA